MLRYPSSMHWSSGVNVCSGKSWMERLVLNTKQRADKGKYISNLLCAQPSRPLWCMHVVWSIAAACDKQWCGRSISTWTVGTENVPKPEHTARYRVLQYCLASLLKYRRTIHVGFKRPHHLERGKSPFLARWRVWFNWTPVTYLVVFNIHDHWSITSQWN